MLGDGVDHAVARAVVETGLKALCKRPAHDPPERRVFTSNPGWQYIASDPAPQDQVYTFEGRFLLFGANATNFFFTTTTKTTTSSRR